MKLYSTRSARQHPRWVWALAWGFLAIGLLTPLCIHFLVTVTVTKGRSMSPLYAHGDFVLEWRRSWWNGPIERGDVVTFGVSKGHYGKRVIGLPGETVTLSGGNVFVESAEQSPVRPLVRLEEPYLSPENRGHTYAKIVDGNTPPVHYRVPAEHVFVLADNRMVGSDSRTFVQDRRRPTPYVPITALESRLGRRVYPFRN